MAGRNRRSPSASPTRRDPDEFPISGYGRQRLLDTALVLFDEHGIDGVSARTIAQAAGHRNVTAVNYHFGSRDELVHEVLTRQAAVLDRQRHALLDELEARGPVDPREAVVAVVTPLVGLLSDPDGRRYLRLLNQAANHPAHYRDANFGFFTSLSRGAAYVLPLAEQMPPDRRAFRGRATLGFVLNALALQARLIDADEPGPPLLDAAAFTDELADTIMGLFTA